jgi:hypothetical protein
MTKRQSGSSALPQYPVRQLPRPVPKDTTTADPLRRPRAWDRARNKSPMPRLHRCTARSHGDRSSTATPRNDRMSPPTGVAGNRCASTASSALPRDGGYRSLLRPSADGRASTGATTPTHQIASGSPTTTPKPSTCDAPAPSPECEGPRDAAHGCSTALSAGNEAGPHFLTIAHQEPSLGSMEQCHRAARVLPSLGPKG